MEINTEYKDRLFRLLFGSEEHKDNILSLYNALQGTDYTDPDAIELTTIGNAIYIGMKNDVSFIIDNRMPLWEQQSTYNPNMPVRGLIYYGKLYEAYLERKGKRQYSTVLLKIPTPQYIVFYNGDRMRPAIEQMRLSDAFLDQGLDSGCEWTAKVYNLNSSENKVLLDSCKPLADYTELVRRISSGCRKGMTKEEIVRVVDDAIKSCIRDGILVDFLTKHRAEVIDVWITEYNEKDFAETMFEDGRQAGIEAGLRQVVSNMLQFGKSPQEIHDECQIPLDLIEKVQKEILEKV